VGEGRVYGVYVTDELADVFDADTLQFEHDNENIAKLANSLVSRNYRKPFVVPEQV